MKKQRSGEAKKGKSEAEENGKSEEAEKQRVERESNSTGRLKIKNISLNRKTALPLKIPSLCCENDALLLRSPQPQDNSWWKHLYILYFPFEKDSK